MSARDQLLESLGKLAEQRSQSVPKVLLDAFAAYGIDPTRWTGVWFETLSDADVLDALRLLGTD